MKLTVIVNLFCLSLINLFLSSSWILDNGDVLLASGGQDMLIRIWRLSLRNTGNGALKSSSFDPGEEIKLEEEIFCVESGEGSHHWAAMLDSVLAGHEGWVYSVCWQPRVCHGMYNCVTTS